VAFVQVGGVESLSARALKAAASFGVCSVSVIQVSAPTSATKSALSVTSLRRK
jgi:hypothetical protein